MPRPVVALDFDHTLHPYTNGWQGIATVDPEPPHPDTEYALQSLHDAGLDLIVLSCRAAVPEGKDAIWSWLVAHRLRHFFRDVTATKPSALVYLDDRGLHFDGDWWAARDAILARVLGGPEPGSGDSRGQL